MASYGAKVNGSLCGKRIIPLKQMVGIWASTQMLIIKDSTARLIGAKMKNNKNIYRALREKDGKLCIIESKRKMTYEFFVKCLSDYKVTHAFYLDMGRGWNYARYRDKKGNVIVLHPESKMAPSYKYRTNWITFYK